MITRKSAQKYIKNKQDMQKVIFTLFMSCLFFILYPPFHWALPDVKTWPLL